MSCKEKDVSMIFAISGKANSGKDAFADVLYQKLMSLRDGEVITGDVKVMSFADPLKDILSITLGVPVAVLNLMKRQGDTIEMFSVKSTVRQIMQRFGTDAMQKYFGSDVWANMLCERINPDDFVIIPDCRFEAEIDTLDKTFGIDRVISIKILSEGTDDHISENDIVNKPDKNFDLVFDNHGHTLDLDAAANKVLDLYCRGLTPIC